jgi:nucleotide-binding universal stress UspA family protein
MAYSALMDICGCDPCLKCVFSVGYCSRLACPRRGRQMMEGHMYKRILVTLDNSPADKAILNHIRPLARLTGAEIILVHVADGFGARLQEQLNLKDSEEVWKDSKYLSQETAELVAEGFHVDSVLIKGQEPADGILSVAQQNRCDLIAMATHGHGPLKDLILGSVAEDLRHQTNIPILMIRSVNK